MKDKRILKNIENGAEDDIDKLVNEYYGDIYSYCYHYLNNRDVAQDITQEVFLRLFQSLHTYEHRGKLKNFLYRIARNITIDYFKKTKEIASEYIPCEINDEFEERVIIQAIVNNLDDFERELIILRYYQDLRYSAIAAIVNMPVATVRYNIKRIEKKLKIEMEG